MNWKTKDELPLDENGVKSLIIISHGRFNTSNLYPFKATWLVQDGNPCVREDKFTKVSEDGHYGKLDVANSPFEIDNVIAWCHSKEIVEDYERYIH